MPQQSTPITTSDEASTEITGLTKEHALAYGSAALIYRLRSIADDECDDDEWLANVCRQSADEIERLRCACQVFLEARKHGDYGIEDAERAVRAALLPPAIENRKSPI